MDVKEFLKELSGRGIICTHMTPEIIRMVKLYKTSDWFSSQYKPAITIDKSLIRSTPESDKEVLIESIELEFTFCSL